jgi:putative membrane protein
MKHTLQATARGTLLAAAVLVAPLAWAADKLTSADASMLKDIAEPQHRRSGDQMMVDDHSKGLSDTQALASTKGVKLPDSPSVKRKTVALELKALKGHTFDSRYVKQAGVGDHEATEKLLKKTQAQAKDGDLKALASKMLPVVQAHLQHARQLAASK